MKKGAYKRIIELDRLIRKGELISSQSAAEKLGVSKRTIERDLEDLRFDFGADIFYNRKLKRYEYKDKSIPVPSQWLSGRELAIILAGQRALNLYNGTSFYDEIDPAFKKLLEPIEHDQDCMESINELNSSIVFYKPYKNIRDLRSIFSTLLKSAVRSMAIEFSYKKLPNKKPETKRVFPYNIVNNGGDWYFVGYCNHSRSIKTYSLDRMYEPKIIDKYFAKPKDFNINEYLNKGFGRMGGNNPVDIKLKIKGDSLAWVIRTIWHKSQTIEYINDDQIYLNLKCPVTKTLVKWLMQLGKDVTVIKPDTLKHAFKEELEKAIENIKRN